MRILAAAILVFALSADGYAQSKWFFGFSYNVSVPTSNTKAFSDALSWRGATFEGRRLVKENVSVGFEAGWQVFFEETAETINLDVADVTGDQFRYTNSFPLLLNAHYYVGRRGGVRPFVGTGVGAIIVERRVEIGLVAITESNWHFGVAPEIGVAFPLGWRSAGFLNARWYYAPPSGGAPSQSYFSFGLGVAWQ